MGIWSIMGVQFFQADFPDEFGSFTKAMLTMFQLATFDSWVSGVARPVILHKNASLASAPFFISYAFMSAIIMMNVVVAILLDKFIAASQEVKEDLARDKKARAEAKEQQLIIQAVVILQSVVREYRIPVATKRLLRRSRNGAVRIQKMVRGWLCRRKFKVMLKMYRFELGYDSPPKGHRGSQLEVVEKGRLEAMKEVRKRIVRLEARFASWQVETMDLVQQILARTQKSQKKIPPNLLAVRPCQFVEREPQNSVALLLDERVEERGGSVSISESGWGLCRGSCKSPQRSMSAETDPISKQESLPFRSFHSSL
jgi:hypothetical protein